MDPIELQIQQQIADIQQQPNFAGYQPSFIEDPMVPVPQPSVPEANVPGPIQRTVGGLKDLVVKNFNPRQTFMNYAANKALGARGAAIFNAALGIVPLIGPAIGRAFKPDPMKQGIAGYIDQVYGTTPTGQISTGPMAGYNTQGAFGSIGALDTAIGRIGTIAKARRKRESKTLADRQKAIEGYVSNVQKEITKQKGGIGADRLAQRDKPNMNIPDRNRGQISARSTPSRSSNIPDRGRGQTGGGSRGGGSRGGGASTGRGDGRGGANPHR